MTRKEIDAWRRARSAEAAVFFDPKEKLTRESFAEEADVNLIMERAMRTGVMPAQLDQVQPRYMDCVAVGDFTAAQERVLAGRELFERLPAKVRDQFMNDPGRFFEFAADPANEGATIDAMFGAGTAEKVRNFQAGGPGAPGRGGQADGGSAPKPPSGGSSPEGPAAPAAGASQGPAEGPRKA